MKLAIAKQNKVNYFITKMFKRAFDITHNTILDVVEMTLWSMTFNEYDYEYELINEYELHVQCRYIKEISVKCVREFKMSFREMEGSKSIECPPVTDEI